MFRVSRNVLSSLKFHKKGFARHFSTPTLPEYADVVIIGENESVESIRKKRENLHGTFPPVKSKKTFIFSAS
jgi:uncharacterized phosphosugar-binding protein